MTPAEFDRFAVDSPVQFRLDTHLTILEPSRGALAGAAPELLDPGEYTATAGSTWVFGAGAPVPQVSGGQPGGPG